MRELAKQKDERHRPPKRCLSGYAFLCWEL